MQRAIGTISHLLKSKGILNGELVTSSQTYDVSNPATNEKICSVPAMSQSKVREVIACAGAAQMKWSLQTRNERGRVIRRWLDMVKGERHALATLVTLESGKVLKEALGEVDYTTSYLEWYAEAAGRIYGEVIPPQSPGKQLLLYRQPVGACALFTSWNFPLAIMVRKSAAALAAGCSVVVKPSEETPLSALALAELGDQAGIPRGVFNVVTSDREGTPVVGEEMCTNPTIQAVSFTGSCAVGKCLYEKCSGSVKRLTLELGGNAPFIVFPSADIDLAMRALNAAKFHNNGQTCIGANRVLVHSSRLQEVLERCERLLEGKKVGNGMEDGVELGPLINQSGVDKVTRHVTDAVSKGGKVLIGGKRIPGRGYFYEPTLITGLSQEMEVWREETFGPVIFVRSFETEEEAIQLANNVKEGLAAYIISSEYQQIFRVTSQLQFGIIGVNEGAIRSVVAPFGGVKESGFGREGGLQGMDEYLQYKLVCTGGLN